LAGDEENPMKDLEMFIKELAEKNDVDPQKAIHIFKIISDPGNTEGYSDDDIEALTGYKQAEIRRILRLLYDARIARYRKGIHPSYGVARYFWSVDSNSINYMLLKRKREVLEKLKQRLEYESSNEFYRCSRDGSRYTFNEAYHNDFRCTRCGSLLVLEDNSAIVKALREVVERLEREIEEDERKVYGS
jgi:transcription initiation factor TFIIE subunit alpha